MPTKTRFIVAIRGDRVLCGNQAKAFIETNAKPPYFPLKWTTMPHWRRLAWLARSLPGPPKVFIFREGTRTKATRSRYWAKLVELGVAIPNRPYNGGGARQAVPRRPLRAVLPGGPGLRLNADVNPEPPMRGPGWNPGALAGRNERPYAVNMMIGPDVVSVPARSAVFYGRVAGSYDFRPIQRPEVAAPFAYARMIDALDQQRNVGAQLQGEREHNQPADERHAAPAWIDADAFDR